MRAQLSPLAKLDQGRERHLGPGRIITNCQLTWLLVRLGLVRLDSFILTLNWCIQWLVLTIKPILHFQLVWPIPIEHGAEVSTQHGKMCPGLYYRSFL